MRDRRSRLRGALVWAALVVAAAVPLLAAAASPQLAWRHPTYILAGFAGVVALILLFVQPLLMTNLLAGVGPARARQLHKACGALLVAAVLLHVGGLWITSPPDVIDALLFESPTPFSPWGVVAMWAVFIVAGLAAVRRTLRMRPRVWRTVHLALAVVIAGGSMVHALLIEGTMETVSKIGLCLLIVVAVGVLFWVRWPILGRAPSA